MEDPEDSLDGNKETTAHFNFETGEDAEVDNSSGRKWKISKCVDGKMTHYDAHVFKTPLTSRICLSLLPKETLGITVCKL